MKKNLQTFSLFFILSYGGFAQILGTPPKAQHTEMQNFENTFSSNYAQLRSVTTTCNRTTIVNNYNANYLGSACNSTTLGWTGSVGTCNAGIISTAAQNLTFQRINYFRNLVGLTDVSYSNTYDLQTQEAALMMKANNALNHFPPNTWTCYTINGYNGAGNSNLSLGNFASNAMKSFMDDTGPGNYMAGHRRWIIYSRALTFGHGSTDNSDALWVQGATGTPSTLPAFIAWPIAGYMPRTLIPQRWSFGIPNADFSAANIVVLDENNNSVSLTKNTVETGYGDNTLVWDLAVAPTFSGTADVLYKVTISGVKIGGVTQSPYTYNVVATDATTDATLSIISTNPNCGQGMNNATATANFDKGAKSYLWNTGATTQTINGLAPGTYSVTVTDKNDCTYTKSITISGTTSMLPIVSNNASTPNCAGSLVILSASNCSGTYTWTNGLGTGATKTVSPTSTTTYGVSCTEGSCAASANANTTVSVSPSPTVACIPSVTNGLSQYFGITNFTFTGITTINSSSSTSLTDGVNYTDKSCTTKTTVNAGSSYTLSVTGNFTNVHAVKIYLDYNNNGSFTDAGEMVLSGNTSGASGGNVLTGTISIPTTAVQSTLLRMRVLADPSSSSNSCTIVGANGFGSGQIEDYGITINPLCNSDPIVLVPPTDDISSGTIKKETDGTITASNKILYTGSAYNVKFDSKKSILLIPPTTGVQKAFIVESGSGTSFTAYIDGCGNQ